MSSKPNHRRGQGRIQGNGPRFENGNPEAGCNSTHVAHSRKTWKTMGRRAERRTGLRGANGVSYRTGAGQQLPDDSQEPQDA
jgi:hypothetical protein